MSIGLIYFDEGKYIKPIGVFQQETSFLYEKYPMLCITMLCDCRPLNGNNAA